MAKRTTVSTLKAAAGVGEELAAIEQGHHAAQAADDHGAGLAVAALDLHAGHPAEDFRDVLVGELAHILGRDRIDDAGVLALLDEVLVQRVLSM